MFTTKKIAIVSVINDLVTDNRVNRTCQTLVECGYEVILIGRKLPGSMPLPAWPFQAIRMKLLFLSGPAFYFFFMTRLFFKILFKKADLLFSNDLDTLLPNYLASRIKRIPLIYDSHELFCEVPELRDAHLKRRVWKTLEAYLVPRLKYCITVNDSIARIFTSEYKVLFNVVRNITDPVTDFVPKSRKELSLPVDKKIIILQGAGINVDRGVEELVRAMQYLDGVVLLIIGGGDSWNLLSLLVRELDLNEKVMMIEKLPKRELLNYTYNSDLGLTLDKSNNQNYFNSLPNKIFDYLNAGLPVLASRLPEIENIIATYNVGDFIESHEPQHIAEKIDEMLHSPLLEGFKRNTDRANKDLNWTNEKVKLVRIIKHSSQHL